MTFAKHGVLESSRHACWWTKPALVACQRVAAAWLWEAESWALFQNQAPLCQGCLLVSYISLFNGAVSRIALWTQTPGSELQCLLGHSKFSSFFFSGLLAASRSNGLDPGVRFGLQNSQAGSSAQQVDFRLRAREAHIQNTDTSVPSSCTGGCSITLLYLRSRIHLPGGSLLQLKGAQFLKGRESVMWANTVSWKQTYWVDSVRDTGVWLHITSGFHASGYRSGHQWPSSGYGVSIYYCLLFG